MFSEKNDTGPVEQQQCRKRRWRFETGKKSDKAQGRKRRERKWEGHKGSRKGSRNELGLVFSRMK